MQHPKRILITGASGFLGRAVMDQLGGASKVIGLAHRHAAGGLWPVDLRDLSAFRAVVEEARPDVVVHCTAYRDPDFCETEQEETRRLNVAPVRALVDTLPLQARLVFVSTDYVFDGEHPPYREDDERRPVNFYGWSKKEGEDMVAERASSVILRIPLLMGCGETFAESGFIAKMARAIADGDDMELDDCTMRYPTDIRDVAAAIAFLLERDASGVYHCSGRRGQTQYQWARELAERMKADADRIRPVAAPSARKAFRPTHSRLATDRIRSLGFERCTDFREVADRVLEMRA